MDKDYFCAISSIENKDSLIGTASGFNRLLLIEYSGSFLNDAFKDSSIDEDVKERIEKEFLSKSGTRLLLIKKLDEIDNAKGINVFAIYNDSNNYRTNHFIIKSYSDLLLVDFTKLFSVNNFLESFYLVCTNGKKDKCCGKFGMKIYRNLKSKDVSTWQCSHVGGDRFAPNIIVVPYFINYGHVEEENLDAIIAATKKKEVVLKNFRGISSLSLSAQAAEGFF